MTTLEILTIPDPRLKRKSIEINSFDDQLKKTVADMYETLYATGNGIGLAAPQVGILKRIVVIDLKVDGNSSPITFINPKIVRFSETKSVNEEGCLSIPDYYSEIERPQEVDVEWYDEEGKKSHKTLNGLLSICIQHEIDHLNGILFIDYLSKLKRKLAIEKVKKNQLKHNK